MEETVFAETIVCSKRKTNVTVCSSAQGKDELLGRSVCAPVVKLNTGMDQVPKLLWHPIIQRGQQAGEALVAAELILKNKVGF